MIDMTTLAAIEGALKANLGLECFHRACITTYEMAPPRQNGTALFEGQPYHVSGNATHDHLYFRHPTLNVLVLVECVWGDFWGEPREHISLEVAGDAKEWVHPGETRLMRDAEGHCVYQDPNPTPWDEPLRVPVPQMPHGYKAYGGASGGGGPCQRKYGGAVVPPESMVEVLRHIFEEHYNLKLLSEDRFEEFMLTGFMPYYCWERTVSAFFERFPLHEIRDIADRFYGGEA